MEESLIGLSKLGEAVCTSRHLNSDCRYMYHNGVYRLDLRDQPVMMVSSSSLFLSGVVLAGIVLVVVVRRHLLPSRPPPVMTSPDKRE